LKPIAVAASILLALSIGAHAHGDTSHQKTHVDPDNAEQQSFGRAGDPKAVKRTMRISMRDSMRFSPAHLTVKQGETVRFVVRNDGKLLHEMILGTEEELAKHAELMRKFPDMQHDEPHMVHVQPGRTDVIVWTFNRPGEFRFACLAAGHYESGMIGTITVR
jgi:uncharacterized cupredoxin-like copper-binding protein